MNVFIMILMTAMFAVYQFFMAKRGESDIDREVMSLEISLKCLKQFHEYAAAMNGEVTDFDSNGVSRITTRGVRIEPTFECVGSEDFISYKYCVKQGFILTDCSVPGAAGSHCVATTSRYPVPSNRKDLLFKMKIYEVVEGKIDGRDIPDELRNDYYGMTTCVPADRILNKKRGGKDCARGHFAELLDDGTYECRKRDSLSPCTAHEEEISADNAPHRANCTKISEDKFCCAKPAGSVCEDSSAKDKKVADWDSQRRVYRCLRGDEACPPEVAMPLMNEYGDSIAKPASVQSPFAPKYNARTSKFDCNYNQDSFINKCKQVAADEGYVYDKVSGFAKGQSPECLLHSKSSLPARANCGACGDVKFDGGAWRCEYKTIEDITNSQAGYVRSKQAAGCFKGCGNYTMDIANRGVINGARWGLKWDDSEKMYSCFTCGEGYYNNACDSDASTDADCGKVKSEGSCAPAGCRYKYQDRRADGACYTRWCKHIPESIDAKVGDVLDTDCSKLPAYPFMAYNPEEGWNCAYCTRTGAEAIRYRAE